MTCPVPPDCSQAHAATFIIVLWMFMGSPPGKQVCNHLNADQIKQENNGPPKYPFSLHFSAVHFSQQKCPCMLAHLANLGVGEVRG
eukprot:CAMPEP_0174297406 /NCGR_PEP_ID=MMETSP0809-20121228/50912_1 /TAXON_ID=73025 ORGANISM="Eutreptiella gymnastica-like, Strain CCMP1594" /NCGR_SAMPLE_ID=MMETSP0809 /ASSEMBLY_ACC=CAM_ASM_000658 /LENGTH=85 /DNA_ID=CAMNT_0015401181 /DNA_START=42 /DNA_END=299 /DNA_ORIENTATION=+